MAETEIEPTPAPEPVAKPEEPAAEPAPEPEPAAPPAPEPAAEPAAEAADDDDDDDEELPPGQYEGDQVVTGKRQRKSADKFEYDHKETKKAAVGTGTPLGELTGVNENMMNPKFKDTLEALHLLVLKSKGAKGKVRKNLAAFSGLVYAQPDERQRYADRLGKLKIPVVNAMLDMLRVDRSSKSFEGGKVDKDAVCGRLLDFLENPDNAGVKKASRVTRAPGAKRGAAPKKKAAPAKKAAPKRKAKEAESEDDDDVDSAEVSVQVALFRAVAKAEFDKDPGLDRKELMVAVEATVGTTLKCTEFKAVCKALVKGEAEPEADAPKASKKRKGRGGDDDDDFEAEVMPEKKKRGAPKARSSPAKAPPADDDDEEAEADLGGDEPEAPAAEEEAPAAEEEAPAAEEAPAEPEDAEMADA